MVTLEIIWQNVAAASLIFLAITMLLVIILLIAKKWLVASGEITIDINNGQKELRAPAGKTLLATLNDGGVHTMLLP